jgi:uncharacterized membrane protein YfcA
MERRQELQGTVYLLVAVDAVLVLIAVLLSRFVSLTVLAPVGFAILLTLDYLFLRRSLKKVDPRTAEDSTRPRSRRFYGYACSAIFFIGTLYGVLMISEGELPRRILPLLLVPLMLAVYCLITARRAGARKSD